MGCLYIGVTYIGVNIYGITCHVGYMWDNMPCGIYRGFLYRGSSV